MDGFTAGAYLGVLIAIIFVGLRIYGVIYCVKKAEELNRNSGGWAMLGLLIPIIAILIISNMKKKISWHENS